MVQIWFADTQVRKALEEIEDRNVPLVALWEKAKQLLTMCEFKIFNVIFLGPKPREVVHVMDSEYATRELGPMALVPAYGFTDAERGIIYLFPTASPYTVVHEYLHLVLGARVRRDIPLLAEEIREVLSTKFGIETNVVDIEESLRANEMLVEELMIHTATALVARSLYPEHADNSIRQYATALATAVASDLDLAIALPELTEEIRALAYRHTVTRYRTAIENVVSPQTCYLLDALAPTYARLAEIYRHALTKNRDTTLNYITSLIYYTLSLLQSK